MLATILNINNGHRLRNLLCLPSTFDFYKCKIECNMVKPMSFSTSAIDYLTATRIAIIDMLSHRLQQVRIRLTQYSALYRALGPLTKKYRYHSYIIFTLIDRNPCVILFDAIDNDTLKNSTKAKLMKYVVLRCIGNVIRKSHDDHLTPSPQGVGKPCKASYVLGCLMFLSLGSYQPLFLFYIVISWKTMYS